MHLFADDSEITEPNRLPAKFDLVDTVRAQYELLETLEEDGACCDVPFCCTCSNRGCTSLQWDVTREDDDISLSMTDLGGERIGDSPYRLSWESLCTCVHDLGLTVVDFCAASDVDKFERADWVDAPHSGYYETRAELQRYADEVQTLQGSTLAVGARWRVSKTAR